MYEKFYHFNENPFGMTPDPKFFFPSPKHTEALDSLIYTVAERRGFAVITGEIGSGKTTICRTLLNRLDSGTKVSMITNTHLTSEGLLSYILEDLGVSFNGRAKSGLLCRLKEFLIEQLSLDFNVVLIIDEAQNLSLNILEEIRMLSNLETEKEKMIQIILTGQPELKDKLESEELAQLRQRINVQYHILPLNRQDSEKYINHRLRLASINANKEVEFTPEAIDEIYGYSRGIPRTINKICNSALLIGYVIEARQITPQIIKEAVSLAQDQLKNIPGEPKVSQPQLQEAETRLKQLNEQLNQLKKHKEKTQAGQAGLEQFWRKRQGEWQVKQERASRLLQSTRKALSNCESSFREKAKEHEKLLAELKSTQEELQRQHLEITRKKSDKDSVKEPVVKLKAGQPGVNRAVLTAYTFEGEIKIDPVGNDGSPNPIYNAIRAFHHKRGIGKYKNFTFSAKGDRKRGHSTEFRVELSNGAAKIGRHHGVTITDSWQRFAIPLEEFNSIVNLNFISEVTLFLDGIMDADEITYIKDICFSHK